MFIEKIEALKYDARLGNEPWNISLVNIKFAHLVIETLLIKKTCTSSGYE